MLYPFCENNHEKRLSHCRSVFLSCFHLAEKQNYLLFPYTLKVHEIAGVDFPCALSSFSIPPTLPITWESMNSGSYFRILHILPWLIPTLLQLHCQPCIGFLGGLPQSSYTAEYLQAAFLPHRVRGPWTHSVSLLSLEHGLQGYVHHLGFPLAPPAHRDQDKGPENLLSFSWQSLPWAQRGAFLAECCQHLSKPLGSYSHTELLVHLRLKPHLERPGVETRKPGGSGLHEAINPGHTRGDTMFPLFSQRELAFWAINLF